MLIAFTSEVSLHNTGIWACAVVGAAAMATVSPMVSAQTPRMDRNVRTVRMTPPGRGDVSYRTSRYARTGTGW